VARIAKGLLLGDLQFSRSQVLRDRGQRMSNVPLGLNVAGERPRSVSWYIVIDTEEEVPLIRGVVQSGEVSDVEVARIKFAK
jgi:hypothetical protein